MRLDLIIRIRWTKVSVVPEAWLHALFGTLEMKGILSGDAYCSPTSDRLHHIASCCPCYTMNSMALCVEKSVYQSIIKVWRAQKYRVLIIGYNVRGQAISRYVEILQF